MLSGALGTGQAYALMGNSLIRETDINTIFIQNVWLFKTDVEFYQLLCKYPEMIIISYWNC